MLKKIYLIIVIILGLTDEDSVPAKKKSKPEQGKSRVKKCYEVL